MTDHVVPPVSQGHTLQRKGDRYVVRWLEGGYWHARYFAPDEEATDFLAYVREYDPNAYMVATA